jgi:hypothetical protein
VKGLCRSYRGSVRSFGAALSLAGLAATGLLVVAAGTAARSQAEVRWRPLKVLPGIVDVVGPRADSRLVIATRPGLFLLRRGGSLTPFARGPNGYRPAGGEPYIALARDRRVPTAGCSFRRDDVYAIEPTATPGIVRIDRRGRARRFADLPAGAFPSGIGFDTVGRFGNRLLVTALFGPSLTVYALDCRGRATVVLEGGPRVEGGIAVAPRMFGRFAGQLIAPDEVGGKLIAINSRGRSEVLIDYPFPAGGDIGPESVGFVPPGFDRRGAAYLADLGAPGAPTPGTDSLLTARGRELVRAGVRPGDLLVATEAGALTFAVRCRQRCTVRRIGRGPTVTHGEGHLIVVAAPR